MTSHVGRFEDRVLPYFFNPHGKLCFERLSSMILVILAWVGTVHYVFADEPWQGMTGTILSLLVGGFLPEVRFVIQQAGKRPAWGGLDPLGWATDYNGHPSTHRVKMLVSVFLGCFVIFSDAFGNEPETSPGLKLVGISLVIVPQVLAFVFEVIERRGIVKESCAICEETKLEK